MCGPGPRQRYSCNNLSQFRVTKAWPIHAFLTFVTLAFPLLFGSVAHDMSPFKGQTGLKRILNASGYSLDGLRAAFTGEAAFRQLVLLNVILIPISFFLNVSRVEQALLIAVCLLALIVELLNSAVEAAIDRISLELHPLSKNAKDMGSAAQFVALSMIALVWAVILL